LRSLLQIAALLIARLFLSFFFFVVVTIVLVGCIHKVVTHDILFKKVLLEPKVDTNYFKGMYKNEAAVLQPMLLIITSGYVLTYYRLPEQSSYYASYHVPLKNITDYSLYRWTRA
jgi:hypothetical protein